jgi:hypothetical protein
MTGKNRMRLVINSLPKNRRRKKILAQEETKEAP